MLVLHGVYSLKRKVVAYRNDFCLSCGMPRRAYQTRSLDILHLFFVPILPLGFWGHWRCSVCGRDPHTHPHTRKSFKWAGIAVLALFTAVVWTPGIGAGDPIAAIWLMRLGFPIAFIAALWHTLKSKPDVSLAQKLKEITPADDSICPLCKGTIALGQGWHCSQCGLKRTAVNSG